MKEKLEVFLTTKKLLQMDLNELNLPKSFGDDLREFMSNASFFRNGNDDDKNEIMEKSFELCKRMNKTIKTAIQNNEK